MNIWNALLVLDIIFKDVKIKNSSVCITPDCQANIVGNKAKGQISKRVFQENIARFEIRPFGLLPTI